MQTIRCNWTQNTMSHLRSRQIGTDANCANDAFISPHSGIESRNQDNCDQLVANMLVATGWSRLALVVTSWLRPALVATSWSRAGLVATMKSKTMLVVTICWSRQPGLVATSWLQPELVATSWSQLSWLRPWSRLSIPLCTTAFTFSLLSCFVSR